METHEKAVEERMETLHDKMRAMTEEFEEQTRSLEGEIVLLKRAVVQSGHTICLGSASYKGAST